MSNKQPRRIRMDLWWPAETAIHNAIQEVERMPADVRLTNVVISLLAAQRAVADWIDDKSDGAMVTDEYGSNSYANEPKPTVYRDEKWFAENLLGINLTEPQPPQQSANPEGGEKAYTEHDLLNFFSYGRLSETNGLSFRTYFDNYEPEINQDTNVPLPKPPIEGESK